MRAEGADQYVMLDDLKTAFFFVIDIWGRVFATASVFGFLTNFGLPHIIPIAVVCIIGAVIAWKATQPRRAMQRAIREDRELMRQYYGENGVL